MWFSIAYFLIECKNTYFPVHRSCHYVLWENSSFECLRNRPCTNHGAYFSWLWFETNGLSTRSELVRDGKTNLFHSISGATYPHAGESRPRRCSLALDAVRGRWHIVDINSVSDFMASNSGVGNWRYVYLNIPGWSAI